MKLAVVRIRSSACCTYGVLRTLKLLNLESKNSCVIIEETPAVKGMLQKVKHMITWGPADDATIKAMEKKKRGRRYCLQPPRKGFGKKGVKMPFRSKGSLGNRDKSISDLLKRMI